MSEKKRIYYYDLLNVYYLLKRSPKYFVDRNLVFLCSPSKKAIIKAGVVEVPDVKVKNTPLRNIKFGKKYKFRAGKAIEFEGVRRRVVKINENDSYLEIIVGGNNEVKVFSSLDISGTCNCLEIVK